MPKKQFHGTYIGSREAFRGQTAILIWIEGSEEIEAQFDNMRLEEDGIKYGFAWHSFLKVDFAIDRVEIDKQGNKISVWASASDEWYGRFEDDGIEDYGPYASEQELFREMDIPAKGRFDTDEPVDRMDGAGNPYDLPRNSR